MISQNPGGKETSWAHLYSCMCAVCQAHVILILWKYLKAIWLIFCFPSSQRMPHPMSYYIYWLHFIFSKFYFKIYFIFSEEDSWIFHRLLKFREAFSLVLYNSVIYRLSYNLKAQITNYLKNNYINYFKIT